jgi:hypothetical protein
MKKILTLILISCILSSCATQKFQMKPTAPETPTNVDMNHFFIDGAFQDKSINASAICGGSQNVSKVEVKQNTLDVVLMILTFGIYTPRHTYVYC